ncbi:MAG: creatininase family protein [Planctomycetota bacterium]|nr:creatininase family protein [Planctomycetota bacterium]
MSETKVRYADLLPHEFRARLKARPVAYLPLGTLEWHGEHLPLGTDAIISEALFVRCARELGGIVLPPVHLGPDRIKPAGPGQTLIGMDYHESVEPARPLDGSCYWVSQGFFAALVDAILEQLRRAGFKAVVADGHGPSRGSWVSHLKEREERFGLTLIGVTGEMAQGWTSMMDHAARNETSLVMAVRPELPDLSQLSPDRAVAPVGVGWGGPKGDPRDASAAYGEACLAAAVKLVQRELDAKGV